MKGNEGVGKWDTYIPEDGGISEVTLQPGDRELSGKVFKEGIGESEITFGVFKVNGIDLMWHGGRAHFVGLDTLFEIPHGDVLPIVTGEVDENGIDAFEGVKESSEVVVIGNLCGVGFSGQVKGVEEAVGKSDPVEVGIGSVVGIKVTRGAAELGGERDGEQEGALLFKAIGEDTDFFTEPCRRSGLSMRFGEHRDVDPVLSLLVEEVRKFL